MRNQTTFVRTCELTLKIQCTLSFLLLNFKAAAASSFQAASLWKRTKKCLKNENGLA